MNSNFRQFQEQRNHLQLSHDFQIIAQLIKFIFNCQLIEYQCTARQPASLLCHHITDRGYSKRARDVGSFSLREIKSLIEWRLTTEHSNSNQTIKMPHDVVLLVVGIFLTLRLSFISTPHFLPPQKMITKITHLVYPVFMINSNSCAQAYVFFSSADGQTDGIN